MNEVNASVSERSELTGNHSFRSISQSLDLINTLNQMRLLRTDQFQLLLFACKNPPIRRQMNNQNLEKNIQVRVTRDFENLINETARNHNLRPSTFLRILIMRHVPDYHPRNRFI